MASLGTGIVGKVGRTVRKFEPIGMALNALTDDPANRGQDILGIFDKPLSASKASTGTPLNNQLAQKKPAKKKGVRQTLRQAQTPLSSDPSNPLGGM